MGTTSPPRSCTRENGVNYACLWGKNDNVVGEDNDDGPMSIRGGGSTGTLPVNRKQALTEVLGRIVCSSRYFDSHSPSSSFMLIVIKSENEPNLTILLNTSTRSPIILNYSN